MADTRWKQVVGPGGEYITDNLNYEFTENMTTANGWPDTEAMVSVATSWTEVTGP